jgi:hypothetical protein
MVGIDAPKEYSIIDFNYDYGFGESSERYKLIIPIEQYIELANEIKYNKKAVYYDTVYNPPVKYMDRNYVDINEIDKYKSKCESIEFAYWNEKEIILKSIVSFNEMIVIRLEKDTILYIIYDED